MQKPKDYDTAQRGGEFRRLPAGGYFCRVIRAEETKSSKTKKPMLKVAIDIAGGDFKDFYKESFERKRKSNKDATWPCICYIVTITKDGDTSGAFKNFVECVRESNKGWEPDWGDGFCNGLKGTMLGVVFREEEYLNKDGMLRVSTKPDYGHFVNIDDMAAGNFTVPERKLFEGNSFDDDIPDGFETINEDDVPF